MYVKCRRVLVGAGYQLSDDEEFVVCVTRDAAAEDDGDDEYDYDCDKDDTDAACTVRNTDNVASWDRCDVTVDEEWC